MPTLSAKPRPVPQLYPFFGARLAPAFSDQESDLEMSIVLLHCGGLSKDQIDRVQLRHKGALAGLAGWIATLFERASRKH